MVSVTKAASATCVDHHNSTLLLPLDVISSKHPNNPSKYRSGNNISSRRGLHSSSFRNSIESIHDAYQKFSQNNLISTYFPIANIQQDSLTTHPTSSSQLPTVPKQAGTFIHRLVNKFFSITNKKQFSSTKRMKQEEPVTTNRLKTRNVSDDSHTFLNLSPKRRKRRQRSKLITKKKNCVVCRKYRNCFSILPMNQLQTLTEDCFDSTFQSPIILNSNATTNQNNHLVLTSEPAITLPRNLVAKKRTLNETQCQTIASAVELIFDTLMSNYRQI